MWPPGGDLAVMAQRHHLDLGRLRGATWGVPAVARSLIAGCTCIHPMPNMGISHQMRSMMPVSRGVGMPHGPVLDHNYDDRASGARPEVSLTSSCHYRQRQPIFLPPRSSCNPNRCPGFGPGAGASGKSHPRKRGPGSRLFPRLPNRTGRQAAGEDFDGAARTGWASWRVVQSGRCLVPFTAGKTAEIRQRISLNNRANRVTRG